MNWIKLKFGKNAGLTSPQAALREPDWFVWASQNRIFKPPIDKQTYLVYQRMRAIRIPLVNGQTMEAEYIIDFARNRFLTLRIVPKSRPNHRGGSKIIRLPVIDLTVPRRINRRDRTGAKNLVRQMKSCVFGKSTYQLTRSDHRPA